MIFENKKNNGFDRLLLFFIALQSLGIIGGALQPIRIFVFVAIPFTFKYFMFHKLDLKHFKYEFFFFSFWIFYALISLAWSIEPKDSLKEVSYLIFNVTSVFVFFYLSLNANNPYKAILQGWLLLFALTAPIAVFEIITDTHLPISYQESDSMMNFGFEVIQRKFASVTYGNLNGYNLVLSYSSLFLLGTLLMKGKVSNFFFRILIMGVLFFLIFSNSSRATFITLLIEALVFALFVIKLSRKSIRYFALIILFISIILYYFSDNLVLILLRFNTQGLYDIGRTELINSGFDALINSYFLGIGAGNFMPTMSNVYNLELAAPHNFFLEILVPYGIIIFVFFIGWIIRIFNNQRTNPNRISKYIVITFLMTFPVTSIINSGYLLNIWVWIYMSSVFVISDKYFLKNDRYI